MVLANPTHVLSYGYHLSSGAGSKPSLHFFWPPLTFLALFSRGGVGWARTIYLYVYAVYIRYFKQGNHHTYSHIRCVYTVLANPKEKYYSVRYQSWS